MISPRAVLGETVHGHELYTDPVEHDGNGGNQLSFTVSRSGSKPAETIYFSTLSDGTATYGKGDFTTTSGGQPLNMPVIFAAGETTQTVILKIVSDGQSDSSEQFRAIILHLRMVTRS